MNNAPWTKAYDYVPTHLSYSEQTLFEAFRQMAYRCKYETAIDYFGRRIRYVDLLQRVEQCFNLLENMQIGKGDTVCLCLPNIPDVAALFYAINRLGAQCLMVHPLSTPEELATCMTQTQAKALFLMNVAYPRHKETLQQMKMQNVICCAIWDDAPFYKRLFVKKAVLKKAKMKKAPIVPAKLCEMRAKCAYPPRAVVESRAKEDTAVILYSGGSSGTPKGIRLSSYAFNALASQVYSQLKDPKIGCKILAILPVFHGFGLGVCVHTALVKGMTCIMVPQFDATSFANLIAQKKPQVIAGVPTLYEALRREKKMEKVDLSCLQGVFCGGDALPLSLKKSFDEFLREHGASVTLKEGYGLTETVTACVVTPPLTEKEGSIGVPLPDVYVAVCDSESGESVPFGEVGEICIKTPTLMLGYLSEKDTDEVIREHSDGEKWLHTGDLGWMDEDGFIYFSGRKKRMFKVSGFPVYPNQIEEIINRMDEVAMCCCVSVPDPYKMNKVKVFVVPTDKTTDIGLFAQKVTRYCKEALNIYSQPRLIEVRASLPLTKVGKVDFKAMQAEQDGRIERA